MQENKRKQNLKLAFADFCGVYTVLASFELQI